MSEITRLVTHVIKLPMLLAPVAKTLSLAHTHTFYFIKRLLNLKTQQQILWVLGREGSSSELPEQHLKSTIWITRNQARNQNALHLT